MMPVMFLFILNSYPSGLSYYYFLANLITIGQTLLIRSFVDEDKIRAQLQVNKKKPKLNHWIQTFGKANGYRVLKEIKDFAGFIDNNITAEQMQGKKQQQPSNQRQLPGALLLQGKDIGSGSFIGAGSLLTKDVPENVFFVGCPARRIKTLDEF